MRISDPISRSEGNIMRIRMSLLLLATLALLPSGQATGQHVVEPSPSLEAPGLSRVQAAEGVVATSTPRADCWYCGRCSFDELFFSPDEFPDSEPIASFGGTEPFCARADSCDDLLPCIQEDADADQDAAATALAHLVDAEDWREVGKVARSSPGLVKMVPQRNLLLVTGAACSGGVRYVLQVPRDVMVSVMADQESSSVSR